MPNRRPFRVRTHRLTVRAIERDDITVFTHYRNLPEVSRYQDWPTPYTRDLAHELVDGMERLGGPSPGEWVQLAIDAGDGIIGDVAVWLDDSAELAMIGYTLDPAHQGRGYAIEAVDGVVDWLFRRKRVHRIAATIDPENAASARVLERCGFEYVGTARSAALVRGEWADDARFSLLEADWVAWRDRPTAPPERVDLVEITSENVLAVGEIDRSFSQRAFVAPTLESLAQALTPPIVGGEPLRPWLRAIRADDELAGFVAMVEPHRDSPHPYLWRLTVDHRHQGRGIGRRALEEIARERRESGHTHLRVRYVRDGVGAPAAFYEHLGFVPTGRVDGDEHEALLDLAP